MKRSPRVQNTFWRDEKSNSSLILEDIMPWVVDKILTYYSNGKLNEFKEKIEVIVFNQPKNKKLKTINRTIDEVRDCQHRLNEIIETAFLKYESNLRQLRDGLINNSKYESKIIREYEILENLVSKLSYTLMQEVQRGIHPYVSRETLEEIDLSVYTRIEALKVEKLFNTELLLFLIYSKIKSLLIAEAKSFNFKLTNRRKNTKKKREKKLITFGIEDDQSPIVEDILKDLHDKIGLFDTEIDRVSCIEILYSDNFEEIKPIPLVQLYTFHYQTKYIIDRLKPLFSKFNCRTFGESGFFIGRNDNPITENLLYTSWKKNKDKKPFKKFKLKVDPIFSQYLKN